MPAFTKECKLCSCKQCYAQLAIGGKPTAKKGKKCKVCGNIGHVPLLVGLGKKKLSSRAFQWHAFYSSLTHPRYVEKYLARCEKSCRGRSRHFRRGVQS